MKPRCINMVQVSCIGDLTMEKANGKNIQGLSTASAWHVCCHAAGSCIPQRQPAGTVTDTSTVEGCGSCDVEGLLDMHFLYFPLRAWFSHCETLVCGSVTHSGCDFFHVCVCVHYICILCMMKAYRARRDRFICNSLVCSFDCFVSHCFDKVWKW